MINRLGLGIRTTAHHHKLPSLLTSIRCYDRKRYLKQKKLERDSLSNEKIKLTECMDLVKKYALGQKKDLVLQVKLENDDKPVRCLVNFPIQITGTYNQSQIHIQKATRVLCWFLRMERMLN